MGIRLKFAGMTQELFDEANSRVDPDSNPPAGVIFHASGPIEGGWGVIDFWESRDHFDRFAQERIGPALAELGDRAIRPDIKEFPVHEHFPR